MTWKPRGSIRGAIESFNLRVFEPNLNLEPIEEPFVTYVRLAPEILPSVEATLITGITPAIAEQGGERVASTERN
ncbi:MAG: hypothetical protein Ct9H300mP8_13390 [Gammaproteobacteria bacterium]|nr:MAG: hypothetical protein Ct9H300mP8_13390 [Gammaproteobacteria bacterium]